MSLLETNLAEDPAVYKTLLESTRAIPWKIDWATMRFAYIGPQIGELLGWEPSSWVTVEDWASRIHEEDRQRVVDFCVSQSIAVSTMKPIIAHCRVAASMYGYAMWFMWCVTRTAASIR